MNPLGIDLGPSPANPRMWECPNRCNAAARTVDAAIPYHPCPNLGGVMVPLVHVGVSATHRLIERQDHVGADLVQDVRHNGRLIASVETERDDGVDVTVFAPTATVTRDEAEEARGG